MKASIIKKNEMLELATNTLYDKLKTAEYGSRHSWDDMRKMAGLPSGIKKESVYYVASKVRWLLMRYDNRLLQTVAGFGKRIAKPEEHSGAAKKKVRKSVKVYKEGGAILASTNMEMLTEEQRNEVMEQAGKYRTLEWFASELLKTKRIGHSAPTDQIAAGHFLDMIKFMSKPKEAGG
jgi:DNA polymerase III delta prime subunit